MDLYPTTSNNQPFDYQHPVPNLAADQGLAYQEPPQSEQNLYELQFANSIDDYEKQVGDHTIILNFKINDFEHDTLENVLQKLHQFLRGRPAKVLLELGYLLYHRPTGSLVYYYASKNTDMFEDEAELQIVNRHDFQNLSEKVLSEDWHDIYANCREDTHYQFEKPCNLKITVYLL